MTPAPCLNCGGVPGGHPAADCQDVRCYVDRLNAAVRRWQAEQLAEITALLVKPPQ